VQLKAICASHGYRPKGDNKDDIIDEIETAMEAADDEIILLD
jgi:hypothetical protein